jgi:sarcosine oxidase subunit gamma
VLEVSDGGPFDRFALRGAAPFPVAVPDRPLRSVPIDGGAALWLGPDEYLLLLGHGRGAAVPGAFAGHAGPFSLVDVSHRQIALSVSGTDAAAVLAGGVPLDLAADAFPVGTVARTIFEKAEIVLWRRGEDRWHLEVARSFAPYVRDLLTVIASANGIGLGDSGNA